MIICKNKKFKAENFSQIKKICDIQDKKNICFELDFWKSFKKELMRENKKKLGLKINTDFELNLIKKEVHLFKIIIITFLSFKDGRGFSQARTLRKDFGYNCDIRAAGQILPDQSIFLIRSGFSTFEIKSKDEMEWEEIIKSDLGVYYQKSI